MELKDIIVLDTSVLIYDPLALFSFDNATLIIPMVVLEELDKAKTETTEAGYNARLVIKFIEQISKMGSLSEGILISEKNCGFMTKFEKSFTSMLKVSTPKTKIHSDLVDFYLENNDNRILSLCCELKKETGKTIKLLTVDVNLRIKARILDIDARDFDHHPIDQIGIKGYRVETLPAHELKNLTEKTLGNHFDLSNIANNEYLAIKSAENPDRFRIFKHNTTNGFTEVRGNRNLWGFGARNIPQVAALDLLLDDNVPLVFLIGPAGTGKTLLTLLAGLHKVLTERHYEKLFVARPLVSLGADIGFVPGDLQEKLFHWMHPFYDNLDHIFKEMDRRGELFHIPKSAQSQISIAEKNGKRNEKRRPSFLDELRNGEDTLHSTIGTLQKRGFLSLEAITHMRGRTLPNQYLFIDEVQNLTPQEVKTIITRAGVGTKIILAGDPYQIDTSSMDFYNNGLMSTLLKLRGEDLVGHLSLDVSERSALASLAIKKI